MSAPLPAVAYKLLDSYTRIQAYYWVHEDCELWLNRGDFEAIGAYDGAQLFALPVHATNALPSGEAAVFDRVRMEYLRDPAPV